MTDSVALVLLRTTLCTSLAAVMAGLLLRMMHCRSPRWQRISSILVLLQGWMFCSLALELPVEALTPAVQPVDIAVNEEPSVITENYLYTSPMPMWASPEAVATPINSTAIIWTGGAVVVVLWFIRQYASLLHQVPLGRRPTQEEWSREWEHVAAELGVGARAQFRISRELGPLLCFVPFFYLVLCPERLWIALDVNQRTAILKHELAHVKRHDLWKSIGIRLLALPQWFNPLAWMAVRAFDDAAEWACDDLVMTDCGRASDTSYALALLRIAESRCEPLAGSVAARGGVLSTRIRRLVEPSFREEKKMFKVLLPVLLVGIVCVQSVRVSTVAADKSQEGHIEDVPKVVSGDTSESPSQQSFEARKADLARTGLDPYRVEPTDVISIQAQPLDRQLPPLNGEFPVAPDGTINLGTTGDVFVSGMTVEQVTQAVKNKLSAHYDQHGMIVALPDTGKKSKVFYCESKIISHAHKDGIGYSVSIPCTPTSDVRTALTTIRFPQAVDLNKAVIRIRRVVGQEIQNLGVDWSDIANPDSTVNHKLLPGDRISIVADGWTFTNLGNGASISRSAIDELNAEDNDSHPSTGSPSSRHADGPGRSDQRLGPSELPAIIYNVTELVSPCGNPAFTKEGRVPPDKPCVDFAPLVGLITSTISPSSWQQVGGAGVIETFPVNHSMVVSQTREVQDEITRLLNGLRRLSQEEAVLEAQYLRVPDEVLRQCGLQGRQMGAISADERNTLLTAIQNDAHGRIFAGRIARLFNGQSVVLNRSYGDATGEHGKYSLQALMDDERTTLRVAASALGDDGQPQTGGVTWKLSNGEALLFSCDQPSAGIDKGGVEGDRQFILVTGHISVARN